MAGRLPEFPPPRGGAFPALQSVGGYIAASRAAEQSGEAISGLAQQLVTERVNRETSKSLAGMQDRLNTFRDQVYAENDPDKLDAMVGTELPKIQQETIEGFPYQTPEYKLAVQQAVNRTRSSLVGHQLAIRRQDANATANLLQQTFAKEVVQLPAEDANAHAQAVDAMRANVARLEALTPQEREVEVAHIGRVGALSFLDQQIAENPAGVVKLFSDPERAGFIEKDPLLQFLSPEDKTKVLDAAHTAYDASQQQTRELVASNLEIGVNEGRYGRKEIDAAFEKNVITGPVRTRLYLKLDELAKQHQQTVDVMARYRSVLNGDDFYDPASKVDQKQVDEVWTREVGPRINKAVEVQPPMAANPAGTRSELVSQWIHRTGVVPTAVVNETRGKLFNGGPQEKSDAADLMDRIAAGDPSKLRHFGAQAIEVGTHISELEHMGVPAQEAVRRAEESAKQNPAEQEYRKQRYGKSERDLNQRALDKRNDLHWWPRSEAVIPDAMRGEYEALVEDAQVRNGGDIGIWQESAWKALRTVWGETSVNGKREWMKYAPEIYYGNQAGTGWIRDQLVEEVNAQQAAAPEDIQIQVNANTARWAAYENPKYSVLVRDKDSGEFVALTGNWYPDFATSKEGISARAASEAKIKRDREARADVISLGDPLGSWIESMTMIPEARAAARATVRGVQRAYRAKTALNQEIGKQVGLGLTQLPSPSKGK